MLTKNKLNSGIRERLLKQQEESTSSRNDPMNLNYYDLEVGQQMEILLLADNNGELYYEYSTHNVKRVGVKSIRCSYEAARISCAPCQYGFGLYQEGQKDESGQWRKKNHALAQGIVLKSPFDVPETEDGNMVKVIHLPFYILEMIKDGMINGTVADPTERVLVIKKTKKSGNSDYASYEKSFFKAEQAVIPPEFMEAYEAGMIVPRDLKALIPAATTEQEMRDWLAGALAANVFRATGTANTGDSEASEETPAVKTHVPAHTAEAHTHEQPATDGSLLSLKDRLAARRAKS